MAFTAKALGSGGAGSIDEGNITISIADVLSENVREELLRHPERAAAIVREEAIHAIAQKLISKKKGAVLWKKIGDKARQMTREIYVGEHRMEGDATISINSDGTEGDISDDALFHEFFRYVIEGKISPEQIALAERSSPGILAEIKAILKEFLDFMRNWRAEMEADGVAPEVLEEIDAAAEIVAERLIKISSDAERNDPYLSTYVATTQGLNRPASRPMAGGLPADRGGRGGNQATGRNPGERGKGQGNGSATGASADPDAAAIQQELAKLRAEAEARAAADDRARERRAALVQASAGKLADFEGVLAKVPEDAKADAEKLLTQAVKGEAGYVVGSNFTRLPSAFVGLPPGAVETSHTGEDFQKNPTYGGENTRAYEKDEAEQAKVRKIALPGALDERTIASDTPSASEGAPQVILAITAGADGRPVVHWQTAGGNGREMGINLAPLEDQERLSGEWQRKAGNFGFKNFPEGWRGYRFIGVYDFRNAGEAKAYQDLVDKLNPYSGVVQDIATRAEIDAADKVPVDAIADASLEMSGTTAQDYVRALMKSEGIGLDKNLMNSVVKSPVSSQFYMQRLLLSAAFHSSPLSTFYFDQSTANGAATVRALVRASTSAALQMRKKGNTEMADALGNTLATIADYVRNGDKIDRAISKAAEQMEMGEAGATVNKIAEALQAKVEYLPLNKRGKTPLDAEATVEGFEMLMADLARAVGNFTGEADLLGEAETLPQTIERGLAAHARRFEEYQAPQEAGALNARAPKSQTRRQRDLQTKHDEVGALGHVRVGGAQGFGVTVAEVFAHPRSAEEGGIADEVVGGGPRRGPGAGIGEQGDEAGVVGGLFLEREAGGHRAGGTSAHGIDGAMPSTPQLLQHVVHRGQRKAGVLRLHPLAVRVQFLAADDQIEVATGPYCQPRARALTAKRPAVFSI